MSDTKINDKLEPGMIWAVGSFKSQKVEDIQELLSVFDFDFWPEMTGLGEKEELIGFWLHLFDIWCKSDFDKNTISKQIKSRIGFEWFLKNKSDKPTKTQIIGPATLLWALKKEKYPFIIESDIFEFLLLSITEMNELNGTKFDFISIDEPCAFLEKKTEVLWKSMLVQFKNEDLGESLCLHSCGTPKPSWLDFSFKVVHLSLGELGDSLISERAFWNEKFESMKEKNQWLALGVVPSGPLPIDKQVVIEDFEDFLYLVPTHVKNRLLISTSCGIGLEHSDELQERLAILTEIQERFFG